MIRVKLEGMHQPSKKENPAVHALWKKTDPICLLRNCLGNKLRSKHWRNSHHAKTAWTAGMERSAVVDGEPVRPPALVVVFHALPGKPDVDAPVKVVLDAVQKIVFTTKDDSAASVLMVVRRRAERGKVNPHVEVIAESLLDNPFRAAEIAAEALGGATPGFGGEEGERES
jgi:hypothetical protein